MVLVHTLKNKNLYATVSFGSLAAPYDDISSMAAIGGKADRFVHCCVAPSGTN